MSRRSAWHEYQERAATLFRNRGALAEVDAVVQGARARHKIDVWIEFDAFGLQHRWVVECKHWRAKVSKEKVLALVELCHDVGAHGGLLLSESGFQRGAINAATQTNIELTTLADLELRLPARAAAVLAPNLQGGVVVDLVRPTIPVIRLSGVVDLYGSGGVATDLFEHVLLQMISQDVEVSGLAIDLTALTFIDSTAMHVIARAVERLDKRAPVVCIHDPAVGDRFVRGAFVITGLDRVVQFVACDGEALALIEAQK